MDDTTLSRTDAAAATRKRRSSILKSQRPPRTPFCELEFNVTTPTDVGKSRRVSFSRRTDVAEFATNEATTTWKNFYEEHNKSLESSGNDSNPDNLKQAIGHLGNRIFDQQFEEVDADDLIRSLNPGMNMSTSINNINFTQQVEYTDSKLTVPKNKFELSTFTEQQSKLFGDDLAVPCLGEISDRIDINFSAIQQIGENDDLDEIQKDVQRKSSATNYKPFSDRQNLTEYIEVDLNMTHVASTNEESDMSITDTVHSPKVQDVSKIASFDKKVSVDKDWVTDKENIVVNPYIAPRESINFAVNEEPDKVLVFDGKRLIVQNENPRVENYRQSVLPNACEAPKRKTTIINCNDDLPNFIDDSQLKTLQHYNSESRPQVLDDTSITQPRLNEMPNKRGIYDDDELANMSMTRVLPNVIKLGTQKRRTVLHENDTGNISMTQAVPSKIIEKERRQTIVYENCNISVTQAIPETFLSNCNNAKRKTIIYENEHNNISVTQALPTNIIPSVASKRRTILYENDTGNLSLTQAIPNIVIRGNEENSRMVVYDDAGNISVTKPISQSVNLNENAFTEQKRTVVFDDDMCSISVTQALQSNIIIPQRPNATLYADGYNISMTQAIPDNIMLADNVEPNRRRTVVYEDGTGNLSLTQAVPNQVIHALIHQENIETVSTIATNKDLHPIKEFDTNKRRTIVFENDDGNVSITQGVNLNQVLPSLMTQEENLYNNPEVRNKRRTIVFENDDADISVTLAVPVNQVIESISQKQKEIENNQVTNTALNKTGTNKRRTVVFENEDADLSMTQAVNGKEILLEEEQNKNITHEKLEVSINTALNSQKDFSVDRKRTIVYDDDEGDISMTEAIHENIVLPNGELKKRSIVFNDVDTTLENRDLFMEIDKLTGVLLEKNDLKLLDFSIRNKPPDSNQRKTIVYEQDNEMSITQTEHQNASSVLDVAMTNKTNTSPERSKRKTIIYEQDNEMSITQAIHQNVSPMLDDSMTNKTESSPERPIRKNIVYVQDNEVSIARAIHQDESPMLDVSMTNKTESSPDISKMKTVVYEQVNDTNKMSITQAIHQNVSPKLDVSMTNKTETSPGRSKRITIVYEKDNNMSITQATHQNVSPKLNVTLTNQTESSPKRSKRNINVHEQDNDMSSTQTIHQIVSPKVNQNKTQTVEFDECSNTTRSKPIPAGWLTIENDVSEKCPNEGILKPDAVVGNITNTINDVIVYQTSITPDKADSKSLDTIPVPNAQEMHVSPVIINEIHTTPQDSAKTSTEIRNEEIIGQSDKYNETYGKLNFSAISINVPQDSTVEILHIKPKDSILNKLLDMSHSSMEAVLEDKCLMTNINFETQSPEEAAKSKQESSNDTLFYITKDYEGQTDSSEDNIKTKINPLKILQISQSHLPIEYQGEQNLEIVKDVQNQLSKSKSVLRDESPHYKNIPDSEMECKESLEKSRQGKSFKMANDTNELLEMLSDFTDKRKSRHVEPLLEEREETPEPVTLKGNLALEYKEEQNQEAPGRLSFFQKRQSIALSREEFLNNLSMAGAALQKSRFELDVTDDIVDTPTETPNQDLSRKKSVRLSTEVVKTLHFDDDDSLSETNTKEYDTPLKKTAFGEVSYMKEIKTKANVIPEYLTQVSNGIKELMDDLVKPMADMLPFETTTLDGGIKKCSSTCSTQIQANLLNSSQIDLNTELYSNTNSMYDFDDKKTTREDSSVDIITDAVNRSMSRALQGPIKYSITDTYSEKLSEMNVISENIAFQPARHSRSPSKYSDRVLIFDHANPLNNILLDPPEPVEAHRYNPIQSMETICTSEGSHSAQGLINEMENNATESVSVQYCMESTITLPSKRVDNEKTDTKIFSNTSKPSTDQWTDPKTVDNLKDTEVNTVIVMKCNKELLEASSSLTLVDDVIIQPVTETDSCKPAIDRVATQENETKSTVVIYKVEETMRDKLDSDFTSNDEIMLEMPVKSKKRVHSPNLRDKHKHCTLSSLDVTPKPASKMQKRSVSPQYSETETKMIANDKDNENKEDCVEENVEYKKPGTIVTVQQVITMVHANTPSANSEIIDLDAMELDCHQKAPAVLKNKEIQDDKEVLSDPTDCYIIEHLSPTPSQCNVLEIASSDICSSLSSKNMRDDISQMSSPSVVSGTSEKSSKMDWLPESSSSGMISSDTGTDVISKIHMMPFMGSPECEWESSSGNTWTFLLLHARLKLTVRFCPTERVRHDTRVLNVALETLHQDKRNTLALVCVNFGAEMMRHLISRGCSAADEVPKLVRKLAAAARVAARWARAMQDARARLAYSLTPDGWLALKVANTTLRTVWEVTMRLELQVEDARSSPWPRACAVRVTRVLSDTAGAHGTQPTEKEVERVLASTPHDWGHVPRTVWKIFKYLKHKRRDTRMILDI